MWAYDHMHESTMDQQKPVIQIQRFDFVESHVTGHVEVEEGDFFVVDLGVCFFLCCCVVVSGCGCGCVLSVP